MQIDSFRSVAVTLAFLVPGYVWSTTLSSFISRKRKDAFLSLLEFFTLSCVNDAVWLLLYLRFHTPRSLSIGANLLASLSFAALFISPLMFGLILGRFSSNAMVASALKMFGWNPVRSIATAWDYRFGLETEAFVSVTMTSGAKVLGYFGSRSFAGDGTDEERDIYIEKVYTDGEGGLRPVERTAGILINRQQIAFIEFYTRTEDHNGH